MFLTSGAVTVLDKRGVTTGPQQLRICIAAVGVRGVSARAIFRISMHMQHVEASPVTELTYSTFIPLSRGIE